MEQVEEMVEQRKAGLLRVERLMDDVHLVAAQIGVEVNAQKEKLQTIGVNVETAKENVDKGND